MFDYYWRKQDSISKLETVCQGGGTLPFMKVYQYLNLNIRLDNKQYYAEKVRIAKNKIDIYKN